MPNGHQHKPPPVHPLDSNKPPQHRRVLLAAAAGGILGAAFGALICYWLLGMHH